MTRFCSGTSCAVSITLGPISLIRAGPKHLIDSHARLRVSRSKPCGSPPCCRSSSFQDSTAPQRFLPTKFRTFGVLVRS